MIRTIEQAMYENNHAIYSAYRMDFQDKLLELEKEREKLNKRKKNKKERTKLLHENNQMRLYYMASAVNNTIRYYKKLYFSEDFYRQKRMMDIEEDSRFSVEERERSKME